MWKYTTQNNAFSRTVSASLLAGCLTLAAQSTTAEATPIRATSTMSAPAAQGVPTETLAQFRARQNGRLAKQSARSAGAADTWCYVYSTALGLFWAPAGAATGALCLFIKDGKTPTAYSCYTKAPVNLGYGLVAPYGAKSVNRQGRCRKGEWGYNRVKQGWSRFAR